MSSSLQYWLADPQDALRALYRSSKNKNVFPTEVTSCLAGLLKTSESLSEIPLLDLDKPPEAYVPGSLVLFHGMIQDTSISPELYVAQHSNGDCGGWGMHDADSEDFEYSDLKECSVFWATSIPGQSSWVLRNDQGFIADNSSAMSQPHKYPIPNGPHIGLQLKDLKAYDENLSKTFRTSDIYSFIGILSSEQLCRSSDGLTSVIVPTLHLLHHRALPMTVIPRNYPMAAPEEARRKELITWIANEALGGDESVAEWVLLSAISRVQSRHPPIHPLSLTISKFPSLSSGSSSVPAIFHILSLLFPLVTLVPLSLDVLNTTLFRPESREEDLHSGWLQHPKGTLLLLTENTMTEGSISNHGIPNLKAAQELIKDQTLEYVFPFNGFRFDTDINFIVTTEGSKSTFFQTDINIHLKTVSASTPDLYRSKTEINLPSAARLQQFRELVGGAKVGTTVVSESTAQHIENDFVKERADASNGQYTPDDLIRRMLIAKLVALSLHHSEVSVEVWERAKNLEKQLKERL
ncbi:mini-chromosome maintenance replisome factor-domain-containing protein [Panaeolus papilionaceus]|nr:mini-chromosome maintenance replisome factor-domain-containing protein [Panaeolus papilionaceus]